MSHPKEVKAYDESHIRTLEIMEAMRLRPGMYIGAVGPQGIFKLFVEPFTNAIDEFNAGRVHVVTVNINTKTCEYTVEDDGVGIPLGKIYDIVAKAHTGGKFDNSNDGAFSFSAGMNGIGLKVNNALGEKFHVDVRRDGKRVQYWFEKGEQKNYKEEAWAGKTGTLIYVKPDITIFQEMSIDKRRYAEAMWVMACVNAGVHVDLTFDGKEKHHFFSTAGLIDILTQKIKNNHIHPLIPTIHIGHKVPGMELDVVFTFSPSIGKEVVYSYVNGLATAEHGDHVTALRSALTVVMQKYIDKGEYIPKSAKFEITGEDIRDNLFGVLSARQPNPMFDGQTKEKFSSKEFLSFGKEVIISQFKKWIEANDVEADKLAKHVVKLAKARAAARDAKNAIIKTGPRGNFLDRVDPKKFKSCRSKVASECELFIVEGESAGGTANEGRDTERQALFYLKGKLKNVIADSSYMSDELVMLIDVLGCGDPTKKDEYDPKKCRFHKIIIMTDADDDGFHISSLASAFFFKYYPELIEMGYLHIACPPLYYVKAKKNGFYVANAQHYDYILKEITIKTFDLVGPTGKKASEGLFRVYLHKIEGYKELLDGISSRISVAPELIELIVRNYADTVAGKFKVFRDFGYDVKFTEDKRTHKLVDFDRGFEHSFVKLDRTFEETVYRPVMRKLIQVKLSNVRLRGIKSGKIYDGTTYDLVRIIESVIMGKNVSVKRFKGLGEMNPNQLKITTLDPKSRNIVQITMNSRSETEKWMEILLGKDKDGVKKEMFL